VGVGVGVGVDMSVGVGGGGWVCWGVGVGGKLGMVGEVTSKPSSSIHVHECLTHVILSAYVRVHV